jgi:hypothetical protein
MEVLQVGFVERVSNDLNVQVVEVLRRQAVLEVWGCRYNVSTSHHIDRIETSSLAPNDHLPNGVSTSTE